MIDESVNYDLHKLFFIFLEKYKITEYEIINVRCIFDKKNMHYYKIMKSKLNNDFHYFINNTHFNHSVSSIIDDNIWVIKQSQVPGVTVTKILSIIDDTFIIKMMEWFKWQHTESRRIFPSITNKYFTCTGILYDNNYPKIDLHANNIIYNEETHSFTPIDFEKEKWITEDEYTLCAFNGINEVVTKIKDTNNSNNWPSIRQYPKILDYCIEYIYKEIL